MCIGIPMQVERLEDGRAWVHGRGERRCVETALVAPVAPGDWLLVFLGSARERIDAQRAAEVNSALDLLVGAMGDAPEDEGGAAAPAFELPSSMNGARLAALTGTGPPMIAAAAGDPG
ncbi:MAG: HypC/HybG/HupF family hydrogenase formation chaperone [Pseudomonadota bacterium]|jgi:hydrogenase expression/formation protein HypC